MKTSQNSQPSKGTSLMCAIIGKILLAVGIVLAVVPIALAMISYIKDGYATESLFLTAIFLEFIGIFLIFCSVALITFSKFGILDFSNPQNNGEIHYPISKNKLTKEQLLQEAVAMKDLPDSIRAIEVYGNRIDFIAKWDGIEQSSSETFKKIILVQDNFTYRELDYEVGPAIATDGPDLTETRIGKTKKRKIIYRKNQDGSVTRKIIDTQNITNDVHKWLADRGYSLKK